MYVLDIQHLLLYCFLISFSLDVSLSVLYPSPHLEPDSFFGILVGHIYRLLTERESVYMDHNWVVEEAVSIRSLQSGGTFKNVLARKFDNVIIPILAEVIAFLDHNYNLNLIQPEFDTTPTPLCKLWLKIFQSSVTEEHLSYEQMVSTQKVIIAEEEFECQFPFFWLVKEAIEMQWESAKGMRGYCFYLIFSSFACIVTFHNYDFCGFYSITKVLIDSNSIRN